MSDVLDATLVALILLVAAWVGFLILAAQWVARNALTVLGVVAVLVFVGIAVSQFRR
jgi:hypothetical protein